MLFALIQILETAVRHYGKLGSASLDYLGVIKDRVIIIVKGVGAGMGDIIGLSPDNKDIQGVLPYLGVFGEILDFVLQHTEGEVLVP